MHLKSASLFGCFTTRSLKSFYHSKFKIFNNVKNLKPESKANSTLKANALLIMFVLYSILMISKDCLADEERLCAMFLCQKVFLCDFVMKFAYSGFDIKKFKFIFLKLKPQ